MPRFLIRHQRLIILSKLNINVAETSIATETSGVEFNRPFQVWNCFFISTCSIEYSTKSGFDYCGKRVKLLGSLHFPNCFGVTTQPHQQDRIAEMTVNGARVNLQSSSN